MTTLTIATQIPTNINTIERLHAWSGYVLATCNPTLGVREAANRTELAAQAYIFQAADDTFRLLTRTCLPVNPIFMNDRTVKIWQHTQELSNVAIAAGFTTN